MEQTCGSSPASHPGMGSGSPDLKTLSAPPGGSAAIDKDVPKLSMRRRVVDDASSSVRHALRPAFRRKRRVCSFPNGVHALG
eukprot:3050304-Pyramimonas_sp.AAC.1